MHISRALQGNDFSIRYMSMNFESLVSLSPVNCDTKYVYLSTTFFSRYRSSRHCAFGYF